MVSGLLNIQMSQMPGADALKSMGPLGNMISSLGLGGDDEEQEEGDANTSQQPAGRQFPALGRRQRKRMVRITR